MTERSARLVVIAVAILTVPAMGRAQDVSLTGRIVDSSGAVLPGVTVNATHESSGNTFVGVTNEQGVYRVSLRSGAYTIRVELSGFAPVATRIELLVGQQAVADFQMSPAALEESITVSAQAPLLNVTQSNISGVIDSRQMQDIPINGRNWMQLTLLAAGSRANGRTTDAPVDREYSHMVFQFNIDGQQVTASQGTSPSGEPRFSRDAIAEFELATNRFDATQGRSSGVVVNAVSKAGTNMFAGMVSGYFRSDQFKAADFVAGRVLPYSNQQYSTTFGGPIRRDKTHFFAHVEIEREPQTVAFNTPYPRFNIPDITATRLEHKYGVRLDHQFSSRTHLMARGGRWVNQSPFLLDRCPTGATSHPSQLCGGEFSSYQAFGALTQTLGDRMVNEIKGGFNRPQKNYSISGFKGTFDPHPSGCEARDRAAGKLVPGMLILDDGIGPNVVLRGFSIGGAPGSNQSCASEKAIQLRDNFSYLLSAAGQHQFRIGGEYIRTENVLWSPSNAHGTIDAQGGPIPENIEELFPVWNDWRTWNLAALAPIVRFYTLPIGDFNLNTPLDTGAAWIQDDWTVTKRVTLNVGLRYDVSIGSLAERLDPFPPFRPAGSYGSDLRNFGPRFGFAYTLNDRTVLRGGWGKYYAQPLSYPVYFQQQSQQNVSPVALNDGRPDFVTNPFNGNIPTLDSVRASGARLNVSSINDPETYHTTYSYQASVGFQRQIGRDVSLQADYANTRSRNEAFFSRNANLTYNPATGANYPYTDISHLPYPDWGLVTMQYGDGWSDYHGLQTAFTKRLSHRWQASANYTLSRLKDAVGAPHVGFPVAPDFGGEYTLAVGDQRHRATFNGIWELGYGFQLSGVYFYGSGQRYSTSYGGDLRQMGTASAGRLRLDGTIVPRNDFVGTPIHRTDIRLLKRFSLRAVSVDGILEVFNLLNHANYGSYTLSELSPLYGRPSLNNLLAYQPRMAQFAFRITY